VHGWVGEKGDRDEPVKTRRRRKIMEEKNRYCILRFG
jgi:hypothetical protein